MATTILDEWTGYGLANGEHLDYSKAIAGALHGLDPPDVGGNANNLLVCRPIPAKSRENTH